MIPTFLNYSQVMDVGEFFGIVVVHFEASVFRMDSDGSDEAHHSDPAQDLQHIERQDCPSSWALWSLAHQHFCLSISISIMLMLLCVFSKEDDYSKSPQTPSFVSKFFFYRTKQQITQKIRTRMRPFKWLHLLQQTFPQRIGPYMRYWRTSTGETGQVGMTKTDVFLRCLVGEVEITMKWDGWKVIRKDRWRVWRCWTF